MSGWVWIVVVVGLLLAVGLVVDWRRRHSTGGDTDHPGPGHVGGHSCGGVGVGCGSGGP